MYENVFQPVTTLQKSIIKSSGLCGVKFFRWEDVLEWPAIDPVTGIIASSIQMKPGTSIYLCQAVDHGRTFNEDEKSGPAGNFYDINVNGVIPGNSVPNLLSLQTMAYHKWGLIVDDRNGESRLIGNEDSGASFVQKYTSGDLSTSRTRSLTWEWQHSNPAPVYIAQAFNISIGGIIITVGHLTLIMRFQVGHNDAHGNPPIMNDLDTVLIRPAFANKNLLVLADGVGLPVDDGSGDIDWTGLINRHIEKTFAGDTITYVGGVAQNEIIEIYAFS